MTHYAKSIELLSSDEVKDVLKVQQHREFDRTLALCALRERLTSADRTFYFRLQGATGIRDAIEIVHTPELGQWMQQLFPVIKTLLEVSYSTEEQMQLVQGPVCNAYLGRSTCIARLGVPYMDVIGHPGMHEEQNGV